MKTSKKVLLILMSALILLSVFALTGNLFVSAANEWMYEVDNNEACIVGCSSNVGGDVAIPEKLDGYPVVSVDVWTFENAKDKITSITIPKTVEIFGDADFRIPLENVDSLEKYIVHKDNQYFSSDSNGVLYNKDKSFLIDIPSNTSLKSYTYPDSVTDTNCDAFNNCKNLESVTISANLEYLGGGFFDPFSGCTSIKKFVVKSENPEFSSDKNGVLFDKNKELLIRFPPNSAITEYTVPTTVTDIDVCAFNDCKNLKSVNLGKVINVDNDAITDCNKLEKIILPVTLRCFGPDAVYDCPKLTKILYEGTYEQWEKVETFDYDYDELYCLADEEISNEAENDVLITDESDVTVEETEPVTDEEENITEVYDYDDSYDSDYDNDTGDYDFINASDDSDKSDNKVLKIVLPIVAVVFVLIGVVVFIIIKDKKGKYSFEKSEKTQTKTIQKERTLSEDEIPGFVSFLNKNKPPQPVEPDDDSETGDNFIVYEGPVTEDNSIDDVRQEDEKTGSFFEYKPKTDNISQETQEEKAEESESYEPETQPGDKTESWFDSTNI